MIKIEKALRIILKEIKPLGSEKAGIIKALGRVLAEDIYAGSHIPQFDNSAMDGFALRAQDTKGASCDNPKVLTVVSELRAGQVTDRVLGRGEAIRIMTGAPIPRGSDSVVMVEQTRIKSQIQNIKSQINPKYQTPNQDSKAEWIRIYKEVKPGENIRRRGEDIKKGELAIRRGTRLGPAHIGMLASLGEEQVKVYKKPTAAILASGDELAGIRKRLPPAKIRNSNTYVLHSQVLESGGVVYDLGISRDNPLQLENKIKKGASADFIIICGGVSVGKYDLVKDILLKIGARIEFWKVAMRPGKPVVFATLKGKPVFGLPGNPVSAMITFRQFVRPAILKMSGQKNDDKREVSAILEEGLDKNPGARYFLRANTRWKRGAYFTRRSGRQGSALLKPMALANSLIILPEEEGPVKKGAKVLVEFLN